MNTYEICQMDMTFRIQQDVIRLHISVNDTLRVDISQCATHLYDPKPDSLLCKAFSRNMEAQVSTIHQIHHDITSKDISMGPGVGENRLRRTCIQCPGNCNAGCKETDGSNAQAFVAHE